VKVTTWGSRGGAPQPLEANGGLGAKPNAAAIFPDFSKKAF